MPSRPGVTFGLLMSCLSLTAQPDKGVGEWRSYGRDPGGARHSPLTEITRDNVGRLEPAWTYHHGEPLPEAGREGPAFETTPIVAGGLMYLTSPAGRVIALDPETGAERWTFDPKPARAAANGRHRGVAYWESGEDRRILAGTLDGRLVALDAITGRLKADFGENGQIVIDRGLSLRSPPAIYKNLVITGAAAPEYPASDHPATCARSTCARAGRSGRSTPCRTQVNQATKHGTRNRGAAARARTCGR